MAVPAEEAVNMPGSNANEANPTCEGPFKLGESEEGQYSNSDSKSNSNSNSDSKSNSNSNSNRHSNSNSNSNSDSNSTSNSNGSMYSSSGQDFRPLCEVAKAKNTAAKYTRFIVCIGDRHITNYHSCLLNYHH